MMPWSLHFTARKRKVAKKRGRRPGEKSLSPERRSAQPVIPCQRISGLSVGAIFHRDNTGCGTRPGVRPPAGASCAATGIFLMAGVIKPLTLGAASKVRRRKTKGGSHRPPGPDAGPAHSGSYLSHPFRQSYKKNFLVCVHSLFTRLHPHRLHIMVSLQGWLPKGKPTQLHRLRTAVNEVCGSASPDRESPSSKDGPEGADTTFLKCTYTHFSRLASSCVREI